MLLFLFAAIAVLATEWLVPDHDDGFPPSPALCLCVKTFDVDDAFGIRFKHGLGVSVGEDCLHEAK